MVYISLSSQALLLRYYAYAHIHCLAWGSVELGKFDPPLWHAPYGRIMYNGTNRGQPVNSHVIVEQTRGQRQTGRNDLPGKGERVASGW